MKIEGVKEGTWIYWLTVNPEGFAQGKRHVLKMLDLHVKQMRKELKAEIRRRA